MILRSVGLENFGRFKGQTVEFRRGLNLVIGPNEAGKSTLAEAVPAVLFGTNRLEKYKPWGRNACSASLFFEGGGRTIEIKRNLLTDDVELVEKDDMYHVLSHFSGKAPLRGRSASCKEYRELVASLLGVGDDKLFRATYFFGHYPQEWTGDELAQNLRTLVSGTAEADYAAILDDLLEEHFNLTCSNPWGRDKKKEREYEHICAELEQAGESNTAIPVFVEIDETADLNAQIEDLSAALVNDRLEHEKGLKYLEHVRRQAAVQNDAAGEQEQPPVEKKNRPEKRNISQQLTEAGLPENPPRELPQLLTEATSIRQEMAELQQPYSMLAQREKSAPVAPWAILGSLMLVSALLAGAAWWFDWFTLWSGLAGAAVILSCTGFGLWKSMARKKALAECKKQRGRLDQKKIAAQSKQSELSERCEALGLPSSPIDLVRLQKLVTLHQGLLDAYWSGGATGEQQEEQEPIVAAVEEESKVVSAEDDSELLEMEEKLKAFEEGLAEKEKRLAELKQKLASNPQPQPLQHSSNQALLRRKNELEERIAVLRKSVNLLATAVDSFGKSHLVKLNEEASRLFGKITGGRYKEVRLDENMLPSVKVDGRRWVNVDNFSRGTVDAIYLALRVALAKVRDDGRSLPLMLDDPFVHLDQKRLAKALNLIDMASADGQLILFSHNMDLGKRAAKERWHVVPLEDSDVEITPDEGEDHVGQLHLL